ncbi:peptidase domain-containing ABC transporter [Paludibacter sp.]
MDPADGLLHVLTHEEFESMWTGVLIIMAPNDEFIERNEKTSNIKRFIYLLAPHKAILYQCILGALLYTLLGLSTSIYIKHITDNILPTGNLNLLNLLSVIMIVILIFQMFLGIVQKIFTLRVGQKIDSRLILGYYKHLLLLPQIFFDTMRVGEIISRINDAVKIRSFINETSMALIINLFIILFSFVFMFIQSFKLSLIILLVLPLFACVYLISNKLNRKQERILMENSADLESHVVETINSVKTIKQFGIEEVFNLKTEIRFVNLLKTIYKSSINAIFSSSSSEIISKLFTIIILWSGSTYVLQNDITIGELLSFYALIGYFIGPFSSIIGANKHIQDALIAAERLFEIIDLEIESSDNKMDLTPSKLGNIKFEKITFSYGYRENIFDNFSLEIQHCKITGLIGTTGSGKTTLISLLQKLYTINTGRITINGYNIDHCSNKSLRKIISIVPQQINLFSGNLIENIAVGDIQPDIEHILNIINQLNLNSLIDKLPNGLSTHIGENGVSLSGGEKQLLSIARALYKKPEIIIFDEATSSLDSKSEQQITNVINELKNMKKTIIIIAHRLTSVMN